MREERTLDSRARRYRRVVDAAAARLHFLLADLHAACPDEPKAFVTRLCHHLVEDGFLERAGPRRQPAFRWRKRSEAFCADQWVASKVHTPGIKRTPADQRPRERLLLHGAAALRTAELIAILVRTGRPGESALAAGEKVVARYHDDIGRLVESGRGELKATSRAIDQAAYCQIMAGIELGRRIEMARRDGDLPSPRITSPDDALAFCRARFRRVVADADQEIFFTVCLNTKHEVTAVHEVTRGTLNASLAHPREVFRPAVRDAAAAVLLVHNHPSGDPTPSREDREVTRRLEAAGRHLGIEVLDHVIVARRGAVRVNATGST